MHSRTKDLLGTLSTAVLVACALVVTGLVVRRELFARHADASPAAPRTITAWRGYQQGERIGPADARVTIVEFSDFQCPFCRAMAGRLQRIRAANPSVAIVYRHFPLPYHAQALPAARASICAGRQGRFAEYHDALFASQDSLAGVDWARLAGQAGVPDTAGFRACMASPELDAVIRRDQAAGTRLGVHGTPTIMVNDQLLDAPDPAAVEAAVAREARRGAGR